MRAFAIQTDTAWENKNASFALAEEAIDQAAPPGDSLVVLPEMFATGFSMNVEAIAEGPDGPTCRFLAATARRRGIFLVAGLVAPAGDGRGRNIAVVHDPDGQLIATYAKLHPFSYAGETDFYEPGRALVTVPIGEFVACPLICYDLRFPEPFRIAARRGAQLFIVIANWPAPRAEHWRALLIARAIENQACVIGVNRMGSDPNHTYAGGSLIVDHQGLVLAEADADATTPAIGADLDLPALQSWRQTFSALDDIRESYPEPEA